MPEDRVRPARPHHKLTDDGRRMREVLTYSRRGSRFTPRQAEAWEAYADRWWLPDEAVDDPGFTLAGMFGRTAPLVVEIGSGIGEATVALAAARPDHDVVAFEVWRPGVADTLARIGEAGLTNVRLLSVDAVWSMEHVVPPAGLAALDGILGVDGVDGVFIGPADLSANMGHLDNPGHPDVTAAIDDAVRRIVASGKSAGILHTNPERARHYLSLGATFVAVGVDATLLARAAESLAAQFDRGAPAPARAQQGPY